MIVDNDGLHPIRTEEGETALEAGEHRIRVPYFQGPAGMALVLEAYLIAE